MTNLQILAIDPERIDAMRESGADEHGNAFRAYPAEGWEPLRCCLTIADKDEQIALISYTPLPLPSPWAETGPVYVHAERCAGYDADAGLPPALRTGPRNLRTYHADRTLDYGHVTQVEDGEDLEAPLEKLLSTPGVDQVHVRASDTQCFTYVVRAQQ